MSTYIELHTELADHPKVQRLAEALGVSYPVAYACLTILWLRAADLWPDGNLADAQDGDIARAARWGDWANGSSAPFVPALLTTGWLDPDRRLHAWERYGIRLKAQMLARAAHARAALATVRATRARPAPPSPVVASPPPPPRPGTPDPDAALWVNFARVEAAYPANHKADRARAQAAWAELRPDAALTDRMLDALRAWSGSPQWQKAGGQFIPHLATWLEGTRWEDAPPLVPEDADARARKVLDLPPKRRTPGS